MNLVLRRATAADLDLLENFERELFGPEAWTRAMVEQELTGPDRTYLVAEVDGKPVGYAGAFFADSADIMTIGVLPEARRHGVGTALLRALVDLAKAAGCQAVFLEVRVDNDSAIALYRAQGFERVSLRRDYYGRGLDAAVMRAMLR